ncbi:MAG: hypothetical protein IT422_12400 [Pirellulaceae bacterium]|jgi:hypothetical protein|nr:hypothetical protein [Pirellulaceae bacterium]
MSPSVPPATSGIPSRTQIVLRALGIPLAILCLFGLFTLVNSVGLAKVEFTATVEDKQIYEPGSSYHTKIINGRPWVSSEEMDALPTLILDADGKQLVGYVSREQYDQIQLGDTVDGTLKRTRVTGWTEVSEIRQHSSKEN